MKWASVQIIWLEYLRLQATSIDYYCYSDIINISILCEILSWKS